MKFRLIGHGTVDDLVEGMPLHVRISKCSATGAVKLEASIGSDWLVLAHITTEGDVRYFCPLTRLFGTLCQLTVRDGKLQREEPIDA